jgi:hypothetical protein
MGWTELKLLAELDVESLVRLQFLADKIKTAEANASQERYLSDSILSK